MEFDDVLWLEEILCWRESSGDSTDVIEEDFLSVISRESDEKSDFDVDKTDTTSKSENSLDMDIILLEEVFCSDILDDFIDDVLVNSDEPRDENDLRPDVDSTFEDFLECSNNFDEGFKESKDPEEDFLSVIFRESDEKSDFDKTDTTSKSENTLDMDIILLEEEFCSDILDDFIAEVLVNSDEPRDDLRPDVDSTFEDFLEWSINFDEGFKESKDPEVIDEIFFDVEINFIDDPDTLDSAPAGHDISDDVSEHDTNSNFFDCEVSEKVFEDLKVIDVVAVDEKTEDEKNSDDDSQYVFDSENLEDVFLSGDDDPEAVFFSDDDDGVDSKAGIAADDFDDFFADSISVEDWSFDEFTEFDKNSDDGL